MFLISTWIAKTAGIASRIFRIGGGTTLPGLVAESMDPKILAKYCKKLKHGFVIITGTNGKTTTARILSEILIAGGFNPIHNRSGSNLTRGVISAFIKNADKFGKIKNDIGIFELDEAAVPHFIALATPKLIVFTNLFRDQLDRYGELDKILKIWQNSLEGKQIQYLANADDPLVASLAYSDPSVLTFGINDPKIAKKQFEHAVDSRFCACGEPYEYKYIYLSHLGEYECKKCSRVRPELSFAANDIKENIDQLEFGLISQGVRLNISAKIGGIYNVYNVLAAAAAGKILGVADEQIAYGVLQFKPAFGRMEEAEVDAKKIKLVLSKNPAGFNAVIDWLENEKNINLVFGLNDNFADGMDISWIWDADFEKLKVNLANVTATGIRAEDLSLRLRYAEIPEGAIHLEKDFGGAIDGGLEKISSGQTLYVLATYTAMLGIRKVLADRKVLSEFWEQ